MKRKPDIACIVLGAGKSIRFGSCKLSHTLDNGKTILEQSTDTALVVFDVVTLVVASGCKKRLNSKYGDEVISVVCENSDEGMSRSLVAGIQANLDAEGWLIVLGDMPYLSSDTLKNICDAYQSDKIVQPVFESRVGHPVLFGKDFLPELLEINGDNGAKEVVRVNHDRLVKLATDDRAICWDIDRHRDIR